jgi:hypothetical protein
MSAAFHMAQRTGVILSGDYSGEYLPGKNKYGVTRAGNVWLNTPLKSGGYKVWTMPDADTKESEFDEVSSSDIESYRDGNVGSRSTFKGAVEAAQNRQKMPAEERGFFSLKMPVGTYNDGSYTYEVKSPSEATVVETGVTFKSPGQPTEDLWKRFVSDLNKAYAAGTLKKGKAPAKTSSSYVPTPVVSPAVVAPVATPFYKAKWFLPAVAGGTVLLVLAIALWPKKKKDSAPVVYLPAPAPVPVPAPTLTPQVI